MMLIFPVLLRNLVKEMVEEPNMPLLLAMVLGRSIEDKVRDERTFLYL
jgi:TctA family transporter